MAAPFTDHASAWVFSAAGEPLQLKQVPLEGALGEGEVLVALTAATICGSDVHTISGLRVDPAAPLVLGHEGLGTVVRSGPGSSQALHPGQRVTFSVAATGCGGTCACCTAYDLPQKCAAGLLKYGHAPFRELALPSLSGTYATHILLRHGSCIVPCGNGGAGGQVSAAVAALPDSVLCPANCALATVMAAVELIAPMAHGNTPSADMERIVEACAAGGFTDGQGPLSSPALRTVWVQGAGLLGVYAVAVLRWLGVPSVVVTDVSEERLQLARAFGATGTVNIRTPELAAGGDKAIAAAVRAAAEATLPAGPAGGAQQVGAFLGLDACMEVCGQPSGIPAAVDCLRPGGRIILVGMVHPASSLAGLTGEALIRKCCTLAGVHNYAPRHLRASVAFLAATYSAGPRFPYDQLVSPPQSLLHLPAALALAKRGAFARVLLRPPTADEAVEGMTDKTGGVLSGH